MEQPGSYYDWENNFRNASMKKKKKSKEVNTLNSIGIPDDSFSNYLKSWRTKNLENQDE